MSKIFNVLNDNISLIIGNQTKPFKFSYFYNENSIFQELLEYISALLPDLNICQCFKFKSLEKDFYNKANLGFNNLDKYYLEIKNDDKICQKKQYLDNLFLFNNNSNKCDLLYHNCLKNSKKALIDGLISLEQDISNLQNEKKKIQNDLQQLKKEKEMQMDEIKHLKAENGQQNEDILSLKKTIDSLDIMKESEINKLKKQIIILEKAVNGDIETIAQLKNLGISGENLKPKENNIKVDPETNRIIGNEVFHTEEFINFYDVIIDIKSIKDINKGWKIKMSEKGEKVYEDYKGQKIIKIGVIGNSNKGKSFLLSKISKIDLPSGTSIRTKGLSIKYPELDEFKDRKIALLDSAGQETPVLKKKDSESDMSEKEYFKEKSREKLITELFLQNYIITYSDILIAVVGILTYSEQKLLNRIKIEIKRARLKKPLFIIHNLITYTSVEQVEEYINKFLLNSATFNLEEGHKITTKIEKKTGKYFYEINTNPKIFHLIFANEGSPAGNYYNKFTLDFLEKNYQNITDLQSFDVIETVKKRYVELSNDIFENLDQRQGEDKDLFDNTNNKLIKLKKQKEIILKKCLIDELGFSNLKANGFEPTYNYYKKENKIIIRLEASGNCKLEPEGIYYSGEYNIIKISGLKRIDKEPSKIEDNIFNSREFGNFSLDIPLKADEFPLDNVSPNIINSKGVFIVECKLKDNKKKIKYISKDEEEI